MTFVLDYDNDTITYDYHDDSDDSITYDYDA